MDFVLIWKRIKPQQRCAFVGTFIFGLISHGMMLFNKFSVHDDLTYMFTGGATFTSGRWMLFILEKIKNFIFQDNIYSLPAINGFFTFLCISISLCILIDLFEIKFFKLLAAAFRYNDFHSCNNMHVRLYVYCPIFFISHSFGYCRFIFDTEKR